MHQQGHPRQQWLKDRPAGPKQLAALSAGPRRSGRPPDRDAPTSEKYPPESVQYITLQVLWHKRDFPDEAAFRVHVAFSVLRKAAAEYAEQIEQAVSWVCALLSHCLVKVDADAKPCLSCNLPNHGDRQALLPDPAQRVSATWADLSSG